MSRVVVADAGPLIGLARAGHLEVLKDLYGEVCVPPTVKGELCLDDNRPGSRQLRMAFSRGWISEVELSKPVEDSLLLVVDPGEAEAIQLAGEIDLRFLLIDESRGRRLARRRGVRVVGTGGVLLAAKERGFVEQIAPVLDSLRRNGYRLATPLHRELLRLAGEGT